MWGLAFKPETDDMREAPSRDIIAALLARGAKIKAFDPKAMDNARHIFNETIEYAPNAREALRDVDAELLLTEWRQFRGLHQDPVMRNLMRNRIVFDGRNQYDPWKMRQNGFEYYSVGRPPVRPGYHFDLSGAWQPVNDNVQPERKAVFA